jgi:hypothetical protein
MSNNECRMLNDEGHKFVIHHSSFIIHHSIFDIKFWFWLVQVRDQALGRIVVVTGIIHRAEYWVLGMAHRSADCCISPARCILIAPEARPYRNVRAGAVAI